MVLGEIPGFVLGMTLTRNHPLGFIRWLKYGSGAPVIRLLGLEWLFLEVGRVREDPLGRKVHSMIHPIVNPPPPSSLLAEKSGPVETLASTLEER